MKIPITKPYFNGTENEIIKDTINSGWLVQGENVKKFEASISAFTGIRYSTAVSSGTSALHLALVVLGVREGQEVIVPSFTFIATPNSVRYTGAEVKFCDIDLETYNLSTVELEKVIVENYEMKDKNLINKATGNKLTTIITVHQFGLASDIPKINSIAKKYNLNVLEDGACALGARINGKHVGDFGNLCTFSFHPRKSITTGEGGMITTSKLEEKELFSALRSHGATISDLQRHEKSGFLLPDFNILGYNYRMTDIQGALGHSQMKILSTILRKKQEIAETYFMLLKDLKSVKAPVTPKGYDHSYQSLVYRINHDKLGMSILEANKKRNELMLFLEENGISTRQGTHACHNLGYYRNRYDFKIQDYMNAYIADQLSIALPMFFEMSTKQLEYVADKFIVGLKKLFKPYGGKI